MGYSFPYAVEVIAFFTCACAYTIDTLRYEFIYQIVSEELNYTANSSVQYCLPNQTESTETQEVTDEASRWSMYSSLAGSIANIFGAWIISAKSDQIGRKRAIMVPIVGVLMSASLQLIIIIFRLSLYSLIASKFIYGIFGGYSALLIIGSAHLGDTVKVENRGKRFTILETFASVGGGVVLIGTGHWISSSGFIPSSILIVACAFVGLFFVPLLSTAHEGKAKKNQSARYEENIPRSSNDAGERTRLYNDEKQDDNNKESRFLWLKECWRIYSTENCACESCKAGAESEAPNHNIQRRLWRLWFYALSYAFYNFGLNGIYAFRTLFLVSYPVCFTPDLVGIQAGLDNALIIGCPFVIIFLEKCLKLEGQSILLFGNFARIVYCIMMSFAISPPTVFAATSLGVFFNFTTSFIRSETSRLVPNSEQGAALSVLSALENITNAFASVVFLIIYPLTIPISHGFMWIVTAACFCVPFFLMITVWIANKLHRTQRNVEVQTPAVEDT